MDNWDEIRTAYQVARIGTVSGAAEVLGVHHATVIRHIDALESRLGTKLFQRHARGYTPTEPGKDLLQVAAATDDQFTQLSGRIKGQGEGVSGELVLTSLEALSPLLIPVLADFQQQHPGLVARYLTGERLFRLEYGEAHVAIRAGKAPDQPDNVVQKFLDFSYHLAATEGYVSRHGLPTSIEDLKDHWFAAHDNRENPAPFTQWLYRTVPESRIIFRASKNWTVRDAVVSGAGIGFVPKIELEEREDLVEIKLDGLEWIAPLWIVTHVDLHRTPKVQSFVKHLKAAAKTW